VVNIKSFKDSFVATGRLDAEYYQPKYDDLEQRLGKFEQKTLAGLVNNPISSGMTPKAGGDDYEDALNGIPFIRAVDLVNGEVAISNLNYIKREVHEGALKRTQLKKGDVLFSIAGTVGRCALFSHDFEANINQAVSILRFDEAEVLRIYLIIFFNSPVGKLLVSKYARQGLQTNLNLTEVGELSIPVIDMSIQQKIAALIQNSFALKSQSEHLLAVAKRAVEIAIEQDEAAGLAYIAANAVYH
jgi:restriction endonuclease S subunit